MGVLIDAFNDMLAEIQRRDEALKGANDELERRVVERTQALDAAYCQQVPDARPGHFIRLSISDMGIGMSKEILAHLFEPFYTTKPRGEGTGLGLSVVYGIIQSHEGWITVDSSPGKGTRFDIFLPPATKEPRSR